MSVKQKLTESETIQKLSNQKIILGVLSLMMCLALIAVCSFTTFIIDPTQWSSTEFLTNELIIAAIVIMSMVSSMFIGQAGNAQSAKSRISKARSAFLTSLAQVKEKSINAFRQWIRKVLEKEDIETIKLRRLRALQIDDTSVIKLEDTQIKELIKPQRYNGIYYKALTSEQIKGVLDIKNKREKVSFVEPEYYLSVSTLTDSRTVSERAANESKKKGSFLALRLMSKLIMTIITGMIFASLVRDLAGDVDTATAWVRFLTRLWSMISSAFMGYLLGVQMNDIDAEYVEMRTSVHYRFLKDSTFKALTQQEEAKQEYVERVKKEQVLVGLKDRPEPEIKEVIIPPVIESKPEDGAVSIVPKED